MKEFEPGEIPPEGGNMLKLNRSKEPSGSLYAMLREAAPTFLRVRWTRLLRSQSEYILDEHSPLCSER